MSEEKKVPEFREFWISELLGYVSENGPQSENAIHVVEKSALDEALQKLEAAEHKVKFLDESLSKVVNNAHLSNLKYKDACEAAESRCAKLVAALEELTKLDTIFPEKENAHGYVSHDLVKLFVSKARRAIEENGK